MFESFQDYDPYSFYAAERLFFAIRKNYLNQGKIIKGKEIRPIKSCLNYTKKLLYPMKIEYQRQSYQTIITEEWVSKKFDAMQFKEQLKEDARQSHQVDKQFWVYAKDTLTHCGNLADRVLERSPFVNGSSDYRHLKMSLLLNCYYGLRNKNKLDINPTTVMLWKLPKSMSSYVKLLLKEFYIEIKREIVDCYDQVNISEELLEKIITEPTESTNEYDD